MARERTYLDSEEMRVLYVGLTQARRLCEIAVPDATPEVEISAFLAAGFELP
jgi:ATP-dependent exoDNAse (exonuclease V) beta subunit